MFPSLQIFLVEQQNNHRVNQSQRFAPFSWINILFAFSFLSANVYVYHMLLFAHIINYVAMYSRKLFRATN